MEDQVAEWQRLQQEFLSQWLGVDGRSAVGPWAMFRDLFGQPGSAPGVPPSPPWNAFRAFAGLLRAQAEVLNATRKRRVDVGPAMQALLESLVRGIDAAIAAQAFTGVEDPTGTFTFGKAFAAWPALGLGREWQTKLQRCCQAWLTDREADQHFRTLQWRALRGGCERCRRALAAPGPAVTNLRGLYDLFVEQIEAAWHEAAMGDEYARAFGARVNAGLALREAIRDCVQALGSLFELAGRAELDAMDRRLRALEARRAVAGEAELPRPAPGAHANTAATDPPPLQAGRPRTARRPAVTPQKTAAAPAPRRVQRKKAPRARMDFDIAGVFARDETKD
jgi:hypothetical protein